MVFATDFISCEKFVYKHCLTCFLNHFSLKISHWLFPPTIRGIDSDVRERIGWTKAFLTDSLMSALSRCGQPSSQATIQLWTQLGQCPGRLETPEDTPNRCRDILGSRSDRYEFLIHYQSLEVDSSSCTNAIEMLLEIGPTVCLSPLIAYKNGYNFLTNGKKTKQVLEMDTIFCQRDGDATSP